MNLDLMKLAQIFNPGSVNSPTNPDQGSMMPAQGGQSDDLMIAIQGLLTPKDIQFNKFEDMIGQMPNRADYAPSKTRSILAAIAGLGSGGAQGILGGQPIGYAANVPEGLKVQRAITDEPYNKALTDWSDKIDPLSKIAQMESSRNINNRATGIGVLQRKQADDKLAHTVEVDADKTRQADEKIAIQSARAESYIKAKDWAQQHPTYKAVTDSKGEIVFWDPTDPNKTVRSGINSGDLGDIEKSELKLEGDLEEIKARAAAAKALEGTREVNRESLEDKRYPNGRPKSSSATTTPTQERTKRALTAADIRIQHPEWTKWIKVNKGEVSVVPPKDPNSWFGSGPDKETYDQIVAAMGLKGEAKSTDSSGGTSLKPEPKRELTRPEDQRLTTARSKVEPGYVLITDGKSFGQVKVGDVSKLSNGWMVVK